MSRKTGIPTFVTGISKLKRNNGNTDSDLDRKKKDSLAPFFFLLRGRCKFGGKMRGARREGGSVHVSPHVHAWPITRRPWNKYEKLSADLWPGRPLLDLWRYPLSPRKTSALFSICLRRFPPRGESSVEQPLSFFFFPFFQNQTCVTVSRDLYSCPTLVKVDSYSIIFTHRDDCRLTRYLEISRASRNIYCFQLVAEKKKKFNSLRKSKGMIETLRVSYIK